MNEHQQIEQIFERYHLNGIGQGGLTSAEAIAAIEKLLVDARSTCQHGHTTYRTDGYWECYDCNAKLFPWTLVENDKLAALTASKSEEKE